MSGFGSYGLKKQMKSFQTGGSTAMASVALQDHILRNLSLSDGVLKASPSRKIGRPKPRKEIKATIDTGRGKPMTKKKPAEKDKEYVLDPKPPKPTLAQKMGLVEGPSQLLTEEDWSSLKAKSCERDDFSHPCVICKEHIGTLQQVLLSCSHVFHRPCLEAFERFSGKKTCPMCRKEQYQTRVVHEGSRQYKIRCATVIQAAWRGYVVRCWYRKLRETVPPKDPKLRRKFYEDKLCSINDRMIRSCDYDLNGFLGEIDRNLQASRDIFRHFDNASKVITEDEWFDIQLKAVERSHKECPICLNSLSHQPQADGEEENFTEFTTKAQEKLASVDKKQSTSVPSVGAKRKTVFAAKARVSKKKSPRETFCEKVEQTFDDSSKTDLDNVGKLDVDVSTRKTVLLSCSHVFHDVCLNAFEEFAVGERRFVCPVCRTTYQKRVIDFSS